MPKETLSRLVVLLFALIFAAPLIADTPASQPATAPAREKPLAVKDTAPDFSLQTLDNKTVTLSDLLKSGPVVVVELRGWVGYQCPICTKQTGDLIRQSKDILAKASHVVFVYPGPADKLTEHAKEFLSEKAGGTLPDNYHFVLDPDMKQITAWGLRWNKANETVYPSTFIINSDGTVAYAKISRGHGDRASAKDIVQALPDKK